jgi:hypothetical protein
MMVYYPSLTRVMPLTTIRRERILPLPGEVLVHEGARVEPTSLVARAEVPGRYYILNVAQELGLSPLAAADKYIKVRQDQPVKAKQILAVRRTSLGLVPRVIRAPQDGVVYAVGGGRVLLKSAGEPIEVRASLPGRVSNVLPKMGVLIETAGALIQGIWGSGGESFGVLKVLVDKPDRPLRAKSIDVSCHGAVLVGGSTLDRDALRQAFELQVRGIVIGSLNPTLIEMVREMPFPIIATEGLGQIPMAPPLFDLLRTNDGREAAIIGHTQARWGAIRPEVIIPLPTGSVSLPPPPGKPLAVGNRVRVMRGPAIGGVGTVQYLPAYPLAVETGARVWGAVVALEGGEEQFVPFLNLELLG